jgi:hypothetical protein
LVDADFIISPTLFFWRCSRTCRICSDITEAATEDDSSESEYWDEESYDAESLRDIVRAEGSQCTEQLIRYCTLSPTKKRNSKYFHNNTKQYN